MVSLQKEAGQATCTPEKRRRNTADIQQPLFFFDLKITVLKVCCTDALQSLAQTQILRQALQQLLQCDVTSPGAAMAMEKF